MPDYSKSNIYKLCCLDTNIKDIYIGSTCNFTNRKYCHKRAVNNDKVKEYNCEVYKFIRKNGGWSNWDMVLIEEVVCENKKQLHKIEREYLEKLEATLNTKLPNITQDERLKYQRDYYQKNIKTIKTNYQKNKEKHKESCKTNYQKNKEKIKEQRKKRYEKNKEKILKKYQTNKVRVNCPHCNKEMLKASLSRHIKKYCKSK